MLEGLLLQLGHLPSWVLPSHLPLTPVRGNGQSREPIPEGSARIWAGWHPSSSRAPLRQASGQVLRAASVQRREGKSSFLPPSFPPHALAALQGLIHSRVTNMQMEAFAWAGCQAAAGCQGTRGSRRWGEAWHSAACSPGPAWQQAMEL